MSGIDEHYAKEADRLLNHEPILADAFNAVRLKALVALGEVDPDDTKEIRRLQAIASCLPDVLGELQAAILATGKSDGGFSPNVQPE
jgi:hypothetical protein